MRGRRNTHVSTSSRSSADSSVTAPARNSMGEKDVERRTDDDDVHIEDHRRFKRLRKTRSLLLYRLASALCISAFICLHLWRSDTISDISLPWSAPTVIAAKRPTLPDQAAGISFIDHAGQDRWSIYIPTNQSFPLPTSDYKQICCDVKHLQKDSTSALDRLWRKTYINALDPSFMDISEAQSTDMLPAERTTSDICQSSMTFIMDADEASFGKTLLLFWLSYGLAKREGRAFFLDDSQWPYGRYDSYFPPLPRPGCVRPPTSQIVPCPLQAKHVVVTVVTAKYTFDEAIDSRFKKQLSPAVDNDDAIFDLIRSGYESTFHLIGDDATYAVHRLQELKQLAAEAHHSLIGMHIRRGDVHPFELQFSQDYLPVERFTNAAKHLLGNDDTPRTLVLSSDDPDIIGSTELTLAASPHHLHRSQERIQLATKLALDRSVPAQPIRTPGSAYVKHVDENAGWDGGFYTALFHSLGDSRPHSHKILQRRQIKPSKDTMRMRELIGRGYLLDLTVLSQTDGVACAVSSAACRILGVMMGREAIQTGKWVNVDDNRAWSWDGRK